MDEILEDKPQVGQYLFHEGESIRIVEVYQQKGFGWFVRGESGLRYYIVPDKGAWLALNTFEHGNFES